MARFVNMLDLKTLLSPVSEEKPSGSNLEYDAEYTALARATQGKPEQEFGETKVSAEPPKWDEVSEKALDLFSRTKDLRITTWLLDALLHTEGLPGFRDGLYLLRELLAQYWGSIHPQLDPDDHNDPMERINILLLLSDPQSVLLGVRNAPLVNSKIFGRFSLKDLLIASGVEVVAERKPPETATINAAFTDTPSETLQSTADAVSESISHIQSIEAFVNEKVGVEYAPNFKNLVDLLKEIQKVFLEQLGRHGVKEANPSEVSVETITKISSPSVSGQITSREDVFRLLDQVIDYYTKHEPSSPVPLLLKRAKQLVYKDFMEILNDLVPAGVAQATVICGPQTKK